MGRRLLCAFARVAALIVLLIAVGSVYYRYRFSLAAKIWHWKHGYSTTMGTYEVPVPEHWLIVEQDSAGITLMNSALNAPRGAKFQMTAVITMTVIPFRPSGTGPDRVAFWLSQQRQWLARDEVESVEEKTLKSGDESITCIGGRLLDAILRGKPNVPETNVVALSCMSERGLNILFEGEPLDVPSFYTFVSQIHRHA